MSTNLVLNFKTSLDTKYDSMLESAKSEATKSKLKNIYACADEIVKNGGEVTIASVVKMLNSNGVKISKRSIYNQREGGNPYRELIDLWIEYSSLKSKIVSTSGSSQDNSRSNIILSEDEIASVSDHVLRYKLLMISSELTGLRNQIRMLQQAKNLPSISASNSAHELSQHAASNVFLDEYDIEAIQTITNDSAGNLVKFDESGALIAKQPLKRGELISQPGLLDALEKILRSYAARLN